jgi:signal transduction histidine kinase
LLATTPVLLRRIAPVLAFLATVTGMQLVSSLVPGLADQTPWVVLTLFVSLYSVGRHARQREAWLGALGVLVMVVLFVREDTGGLDPASMAWGAALMGAPWAAGLTLRLRRDRESVMSADAQRMRAEHEESLRSVVASERATIARELHDVVAHAIAVTVVQARGARRMLGKDEAAVRRALDAIEHTNTQALGDMRRLLAVLRDTEEGPPSTDPQPSLSRLSTLVEHVRASGLEVRVLSVGHPREVPPGVDLSAYRIIQEALTNVIKHARATSAEVQLTYTDQALGVTIRDDGTARTPPGTGHGLIGIRERVAVVGGEVTFGATPDGGFQVESRLPYALEDT